MSEAVRRTVRLTFSQQLADEPILFQVARDYDLVPTIRRAHLDPSGGEVLLQLEGAEENVESAMDYLRGRGVAVAPANEDVGG